MFVNGLIKLSLYKSDEMLRIQKSFPSLPLIVGDKMKEWQQQLSLILLYKHNCVRANQKWGKRQVIKQKCTVQN
jgi:hypothetical protein